LSSLSVGATAVQLVVVIIAVLGVIGLVLSLVTTSHVAAILSFLVIFIILAGHLTILLLLLHLQAVLSFKFLFYLRDTYDVVLILKESRWVYLARIGIYPHGTVLLTVVLVDTRLQKFDIYHFVKYDANCSFLNFNCESIVHDFNFLT
jgi:hypothetical protein